MKNIKKKQKIKRLLSQIYLLKVKFRQNVNKKRTEKNWQQQRRQQL